MRWTVLALLLLPMTAFAAGPACSSLFKEESFQNFLSQVTKEPTPETADDVLNRIKEYSKNHPSLLKPLTPEQAQIQFEEKLTQQDWEGAHFLLQTIKVNPNIKSATLKKQYGASTPFIYAIKNSPPEWAARFAADPKVNINDPVHEDFIFDLINDSKNKMTPAIKALLLRPDLDLQPTGNRRDLFTLITHMRFTDAAMQMIQRKDFDVNFVDDRGEPRIHKAILMAPGIATLLIRHRPDLILTEEFKFGGSGFDIEGMFGTTENDEPQSRPSHSINLIKEIGIRDNTSLLEATLQRREFQIGSKNLEKLLMFMVERPQISKFTIEKLSNPNFPINFRSEKGESLFAHAVAFQNFEVAKFIAQRKDFDSHADFAIMAAHQELKDLGMQLSRVEELNVNVKGGKGDTALMNAARNFRDTKLFEQLMNRYDTDVNLQNKEGKTALHIAVESKNYKAIELLAAHPETNIFIKDNTNKDPVLTAMLIEDYNTLKPLWRHPNLDDDLREGYRILFYRNALNEDYRLENSATHYFLREDLGYAPKQSQLYFVRKAMNQWWTMEPIRLIKEIPDLRYDQLRYKGKSITEFIIDVFPTLKPEIQKEWLNWKVLVGEMNKNPYRPLHIAVQKRKIETLHLLLNTLSITKDQKILFLDDAYDQLIVEKDKKFAKQLRALNPRPYTLGEKIKSWF